MEIERPDFLPVTVMLISRDRERRSFRASFGAGLLLMLTSSASPSTSLVRRALGRNPTANKIFKSQGIRIGGAKRERRSVNSQAPHLLLQRKPYLTGSPPSLRGDHPPDRPT